MVVLLDQRSTEIVDSCTDEIAERGHDDPVDAADPERSRCLRLDRRRQPGVEKQHYFL